jgi:hypothetical protein
VPGADFKRRLDELVELLEELGVGWLQSGRIARHDVEHMNLDTRSPIPLEPVS